MTRANTLNNPFDLTDAREAVKVASRVQEQVENDLRSASSHLAECERAYREALATAIVTLKAEGTAWTSCGDVARGAKNVAALRHNRDVAEGMYEAVKQAAYRRAADRRDLSQLLAWSQRRDLADDHRRQIEPSNVLEPTFGRRGAA